MVQRAGGFALIICLIVRDIWIETVTSSLERPAVGTEIARAHVGAGAKALCLLSSVP